MSLSGPYYLVPVEVLEVIFENLLPSLEEDVKLDERQQKLEDAYYAKNTGEMMDLINCLSAIGGLPSDIQDRLSTLRQIVSGIDMEYKRGWKSYLEQKEALQGKNFDQVMENAIREAVRLYSFPSYQEIEFSRRFWFVGGYTAAAWKSNE